MASACAARGKAPTENDAARTRPPSESHFLASLFVLYSWRESCFRLDAVLTARTPSMRSLAASARRSLCLMQGTERILALDKRTSFHCLPYELHILPLANLAL